MNEMTGQKSDTERNSNIAWEPWIQTVSGVKFHYLSGKPSEVVPEDICVALSRTPRWAGHTTKFMSVGQHSVLVSQMVKERGGDEQQQLLGLLHDATEAYMVDLPSPLKRMIPRFKEIENILWKKISKRFFGEVIAISELVKECDTTMLATEARDLFAFPPIDNWVRRCPPPWEKHIEAVGPTASYNMFKAKLEELFSDK